MAYSSDQITWPESFGFSIYGTGPSYIVKVLPNSVADASGLKAGDQLLEVSLS